MSIANEEHFLRLRPRLVAIGYRMLASVQEAEDLAQDAWLRWHEEVEVFGAEVANPEAWLVTVTTRMAIDRLRAAKIRREDYPGVWLPEPLLMEEPTTPEKARELADDVSFAFLVLLDCLSPESRAAFLLREVFDADYDQIAAVIGKSEAAARQVVHRAKQRVAKVRSSSGNQAPPRPQEQLELLRRLVQAISQGNFSDIQALLAEEAQFLSDFGDIVPRLRKPLVGGRRIAQMYLASQLRHGTNMRFDITKLNGEWALLRYVGDALDSVQMFELQDGRIARVRLQRNPEKLDHLEHLLHPQRQMA
ncbi:sigma-70 family RNA polymerase sigma factor [Diaphorobacter nitroreducens]